MLIMREMDQWVVEVTIKMNCSECMMIECLISV